VRFGVPFEAGNSLRTLKVVWQRIMMAQSTSSGLRRPHLKTPRRTEPHARSLKRRRRRRRRRKV